MTDEKAKDVFTDVKRQKKVIGKRKNGDFSTNHKERRKGHMKDA